ncbi:hypothetical protein [Algoriphagus winogradskyi]|uniref:Uncharacterized protein n=1 Tax=Algoriphagus winogradskyi TaxID=237017 RepID=A0ABY1PKX0_9BACT|nr:hypothetical protein [Algoriphagus winogradskyi]SMP36146.1 hypothetical protein SAMN06265367_11237 [Algoriphagus winogradskyi]
MVNLTDLIITHYGTNQPDQIVDSYEMIKAILVDFEGQANFTFKLDNTLPLINGDPEQLTLLFKDFISKGFELFKGLTEEINISHIKDSKSWIFTFSAVAVPNEDLIKSKFNFLDLVNEFTLAISKKTPSRKVDVILSF